MGFGKQGTGVMIRENNEIALGTLASNTGILMPAIAITEDFRILKSEIFAWVDKLTANDADGLFLGIADAEMSLAEVEQAFELNGPLDRNDRLAQEQATRPVWILSRAETDAASLNAAFHGDNGGPMITWKKRWTFSSPEGWNFFAYNDSADAIGTTGAIVKVIATHYGVWVT